MRGAIVVALAAGMSAGCAPLALSPAPATPPPVVRSPTTTSGQPAATTAVALAQARHEYSGPAVHQIATGGWTDPVTAVVAFASAYINWTSATVAADMRALAQHSLGQARSALELAAAQTAQDYELARAGVANHGAVEAIGPVAGRSDQYAVVTLERTTASASSAYAGLAPAWHVAIATVTRLTSGRWVLSGWQPEN